MAKIIKVGSQNPTFTSQKTKQTKKSNPIHTHRNSNEATNPFKFTNFEGNTLQFADVFEGFTPKSTSKLRMIASSAAGTMNKIKSGFEPIVNFVNRVREGISSAWNYAKNTNISDVPLIKATAKAGAVAFKATGDFLNTPLPMPSFKGHLPSIKEHLPSFKGLSDSMTNIGNGIANGIEFLNTDITDITKGLTDKWTNMISKIHTRKISADMPVAELEQLWRNEIELGGVA